MNRKLSTNDVTFFPLFDDIYTYIYCGIINIMFMLHDNCLFDITIDFYEGIHTSVYISRKFIVLLICLFKERDTVNS